MVLSAFSAKLLFVVVEWFIQGLTTGQGAGKKVTVECSVLNRTITPALRDPGDFTEGLFGRQERVL